MSLKPLRLLVVALAVVLGVFAQGTQKAPASKSSTKKAAPAKATTGKAAPKKNAAKKAAPRKTTTARRRAPAKKAPARQAAPDADRIRQIQQALAERGYPVDPSGKWGADSVAALKKFQEDHDINNLSGRGKLDSLTLIALGLGPKHEQAGPPSPISSEPPEVPSPNQEGHNP